MHGVLKEQCASYSMMMMHGDIYYSDFQHGHPAYLMSPFAALLSLFTFPPLLPVLGWLLLKGG